MSANARNKHYVVTARKWRPMTFAEVVGQDHIATTLRNAMLSGRVHHAYLFTGPRGVGKTTSARIVAKALNCLNPGPDAEPCNACASCNDIMDGRSIDVIEIDGASNNSVDDVRELRENSRYLIMISLNYTLGFHHFSMCGRRKSLLKRLRLKRVRLKIWVKNF